MRSHPTSTVPRPQRMSAGFSATELLVAVQIVGILAAVAVNCVGDVLDRARLARRMDELRGLQATIWSASDNGISFPSAAAFWQQHARAADPRRYTLIVDGEPAAGGVDLNDSSMEGANETGGDLGRRRVEFVIVCEDDFGDRAEYLYIEDSGPPTIVTGPQDDPGYRGFARGSRGGAADDLGGLSAGSSPVGGGAGGTASETLVGWGGSDTPRTESPVHDFIAQRRDDRNASGDQRPAPRRGGGSTSSSRIGD